MFERILVAIDDSSSAPVTVSFVAAFAHRHASAVHVVTVNQLLAGGRGWAESTDTEAARLVEGAVRELHGDGIVASGAVVRTSAFYLARAIVEGAEDYQASVIVLGSRRRRGFGRVFGRSVREHVVSLTTLPVLVAPAPLEGSGHRQGHESGAKVEPTAVGGDLLASAGPGSPVSGSDLEP